MKINQIIESSDAHLYNPEQKTGEPDEHYAKRVEQMPAGSSLASLYLYNSSIASLPENFTIDNDLELENSQLTSIPKNLHIGGDASFIASKKLTTVEHGVSCGGSMSFGGCTNLKNVLGSIDTYSLYFNSCTSLERLPSLAIEYDLELVNCWNLTEIGNLTFVGTLNIRGCQKLKTLPEGLQADAIVFDGNTGASIFEILKVQGPHDSLLHFVDEHGKMQNLTSLRSKVLNNELDPKDPIDKMEIAELLYDAGLGKMIK